MNKAECVRRMAQVIRGGSIVLAGIWIVGVQVVHPYPWTEGLFNILWWSASGAAFVCAIGFSVAWVLMGFAGDRSPPKGPSDC